MGGCPVVPTSETIEDDDVTDAKLSSVSDRWDNRCRESSFDEDVVDEVDTVRRAASGVLALYCDDMSMYEPVGMEFASGVAMYHDTSEVS